MSKKKTAKNKKTPKNRKTPRERKNLSISNCGDLVVIRNRSTIAAGVLGGIILLLSIAAMITLKDAWGLPLFWIAFLLLIVGVLHSFANMIFGKITLDSPNMQINVYNPFRIQYKFEDVNYIDVNTSKDSNGANVYKIIIYIGKGKRSVQIVSYSKEQADELSSLLRGMLDNGAMIYPEGDDEPFDLDDDKKSSFTFLKRGKKTDGESVSASDGTEEEPVHNAEDQASELVPGTDASPCDSGEPEGAADTEEDSAGKASDGQPEPAERSREKAEV